MKSSKILSLIMLSFFLLQSCEQENIEQAETKTTVVEGYLYAGQIIDSLKVTQSYSYAQAEDGIIRIDDLNIAIADDDNQFSLTPIGNGFYQNTDFIIETGKNYQLEFERDGKIISAETYIPEKNTAEITTTEVELAKVEIGVPPSGGFGSTLEPVEISWDNTDGDYYYVVIKNIETDPEYVNENIAQFEAENGGQSRFVFITEPQVTDFYAINSRRDLTQFGTYQIIVFRVNPEYAALYESSGSSTLSLEQPPTNIVNGLGIFTGVSSDTLYLEVSKI